MFIYSPSYNFKLDFHIFPVEKYRLLYEKLQNCGLIPANLFLTPEAITKDDLLLVHTPEYLDDFLNSRHTPATAFSEFPINQEIVSGVLSMVGGTYSAVKEALRAGKAMNLGGGFHHAFPDHAEGFCYLNDVAIAVAKAQKEKIVKKVLVVDCDLHQGNGTAFIFKENKDVFTFSIHQENLYPIKQRSSLDIGLDDYTGDQEYLTKLSGALKYIEKHFSPELLIYIAGADPYEGDQLGTLQLTKNGLKKRDHIVMDWAVARRVPISVVLGGGYAYYIKDVVEIHFNTACEILKI